MRAEDIERGVIVKAEPCHAPDIIKIENESFSTPWSNTSIIHAVDDDTVRCICFLYDGQVAGYAMFVFAADEGELLNIAVDPNKRGLGIGKALLSHVITAARELCCQTMYLEVRASNTTAAALYKSFGFQAVGLRRSYYRYPVEDAVVMALNLN